MTAPRIALFPGSFDPITIGHFEIIKRGLALFDKVIVSIGENSAKKYFFTLEERMRMLELTFQDQDRIEVALYRTLTVDFARERGAKFLLRGLRDGKDLAYERPISVINKYMNEEIESVFLVSEGAFADISSTLVREVIKYGRDPKGLIPDAALEVVRNRREQA